MQTAMQCVDDAQNSRQPQAMPTGFGRKVGVKNAFKHSCGHADAIILHPQVNIFPRLRCLTHKIEHVKLIAEHDPLRDGGRAYAQALREAGVAVELNEGTGLIHGYLRAMAYCGDTRVAFERMCAWLRGALVS